MKKHSSLLVAAIATTASFVPTIARADWQYTRWGMTQEQVIAASKGNVAVRPVKLLRPGRPTEEVGGTYSADDRTYDVSFDFDDGKLSMVTLKAAPCGSVLTDLEAKYGEPVKGELGVFPHLKWADKKSKNRVTAFKLSDNCLVMYGPLTRKGL